MCTTKFGHPDRYKDRVSQEILRAMKYSNKMQAVAISVAVRFKSSPRGMAQKLVKAESCKFKELVAGESNGSVYEQTGCSKKDLSKGLLAAASAIADKKHYRSWEELEKVIATEIKKKCNGNATESEDHFAARFQVNGVIQTLFLECEASKAVFDLFTNAGIPYVPRGQGALPAGSSDLEFDVTIHGHEMLVQKAKHAIR